MAAQQPTFACRDVRLKSNDHGLTVVQDNIAPTTNTTSTSAHTPLRTPAPARPSKPLGSPHTTQQTTHVRHPPRTKPQQTYVRHPWNKRPLLPTPSNATKNQARPPPNTNRHQPKHNERRQPLLSTPPPPTQPSLHKHEEYAKNQKERKK